MNNDVIQQAAEMGSSQFLKGFIVGQFVLIIFIIALFQLLFLRGPFELRKVLTKDKKMNQKKAVISDRAIDQQILSRIELDPSKFHENESCRWISVLIAQFLAVTRASSTIHNTLLNVLEMAFNKFRQQNNVQITNLSLGDDIPLIKGSRISFSETGRLRVELDIEWLDKISLGIETQLLVNWPVDLIASLPVQLLVSLISIKGTLAIELDNPSSLSRIEPMEQFIQSSIDNLIHTSNSPPSEMLDSASTNNDKTEIKPSILVSLTFLHDPQLEFEVGSLLGHRTKIKDLSKLTKMVTFVLKSLFEEEIVWPNYYNITVPLI